MSKKISYHESVNYDIADPAKILAQKAGLATKNNMPKGFSEVVGTRGESAYVFKIGRQYGALVQEGLGTKSLITQEVYRKTGKSYFKEVAQDTVATVINDLISVGATPIVMNAYWSSSSYQWLADEKLTKDFINGWKRACDKAEVVWGGGETQSLSGVIQEGVLELAGSGFGMIKSKKRLVQDTNLRAGDAIVLIESSGVHANGISLIREIAKGLKSGYQTKLPSGKTFGEEVLKPTHLYAKLVRTIFENKIPIHYLSNITGHGWRKLMRANREFTYVIDKIPPANELFDFIAKKSGNSIEDMYSNYTMGAGYAVYVEAKHAAKIQEIAKQCGFKSWLAGSVEDGPKMVDIKPLGIKFESHELKLR